jgi:AraC-like DNA-binding protein
MEPEPADTELDLPPEYCHYPDEGCEFAESCLNCPLPMCVYDEPGGRRRLLKRRRAQEMARLFTREGKGIRELAAIFGVSQRTVQRALKSAFGESTAREVSRDE